MFAKLTFYIFCCFFFFGLFFLLFVDLKRCVLQFIYFVQFRPLSRVFSIAFLLQNFFTFALFTHRTRSFIHCNEYCLDSMLFILLFSLQLEYRLFSFLFTKYRFCSNIPMASPFCLVFHFIFFFLGFFFFVHFYFQNAQNVHKRIAFLHSSTSLFWHQSCHFASFTLPFLLFISNYYFAFYVIRLVVFVSYFFFASHSSRQHFLKIKK